MVREDFFKAVNFRVYWGIELVSVETSGAERSCSKLSFRSFTDWR